ncbi:MAG: holo-ACP synthase [Rhodospirillaceae bacterium]|nr:holo-ACP synthase [Rhodospirillaceae bacterium]
MILGVGTDIIDIRRLERVLERFEERFLNRIYTDFERQKSENRKNRVASYAKRFAAKEACSKALGTGFRQGVFWRDMGVMNLKGGKPTVVLTGGAAIRLADITPAGMTSKIDISMTDEPPIAEAFVIISAQKDELVK